ncbi:biotin/lipoyl-containing protein [Natronospora cellulosivora (SeqCode)]
MKKFKVKVNGNLYEVEVEAVDGAEKQSEEKAVSNETVVENNSPAPANEKVEGDDILAPLPGTITVKVNKGDQVSVGDVIFILEAMKMENEITAPTDGTIGDIYVSTGENVDTDDVLAVII